MGIILLPLYIGYILLSIAIIHYLKKEEDNKNIVRFVTAVLILIPTHDIIITQILGAYYCITDSDTKTYIHKTVEYPESIYWEDNVYPGFDVQDREFMITNYLDGVRLKRMALNAPDGKIYEYEFEDVPQEYIDLVVEYRKILKKSKKKRKEFDEAFDNKENTPNQESTGKEWNILDNKKYIVKTKIRKYRKTLLLKETIFSNKKELPSYNYRVIYDLTSLWSIEKPFITATRMQIFDDNSKIIANNKAYYAKAYNIYISSSGSEYMSSDICGERYGNSFDDEVFKDLFFSNRSNHGRSPDFKIQEQLKRGKL